MTRKKGREAILNDMRQLDIDSTGFDITINLAADTLYELDRARTAYKKSGSIAVIEHTNKNGSTNKAKNPELTIVLDLKSKAREFLAELGLTPAAQKRLTNDAPKKEKLSPLAKALSEIK